MNSSFASVPLLYLFTYTYLKVYDTFLKKTLGMYYTVHPMFMYPFQNLRARRNESKISLL